MISYTHRSVTIVSFLITISIFCIFYLLNTLSTKIFFYQSEESNNITNSLNNIQEKEIEIKNSVNNKPSNNTSTQNNVTNSTNTTNNAVNQNATKTNTNTTNIVNKTAEVKLNTWQIVIPAIGLDAPIAEGTNSEVMDKYVGHFEETCIWDGNVALAAHNRGYPVNYFSNIKNLEIGDIVQYYYNGKERKYKVEIIEKIKDTNWTYLDSTLDNRITLITCVENEPEYRRCIQAVEM